MRVPWLEEEATFNEASEGVAWEWPGAYNGSDRLDALDLSAASAGPVTFDVTGMVRAWSSGESPNHGFALASTGGVTAARFGSSRSNFVSARPQLIVRYACECGKVCTLGGGPLDVLLFVRKVVNPDRGG